MFTIQSLMYFISTVENRSFTKAAENMYVSQSTVSKSIADIESKLGVKLIDRHSSSFKITREGEIFYSFSKDVVDYYKGREEVMLHDISASMSQLKLGLPPTVGSMFFFNIIYDFQKKYPDIKLEIHDLISRDIVDALSDHKIDIGVLIEPFQNEKFKTHSIYQSEAVLIVSKDHPIADYDQVSFAELESEKFIALGKEYMFRTIFDDYALQAGFKPNIVFTTNQWDLIVEMVSANQGVSVLPKPLIRKYGEDRIQRVSLVNPEFPWGLVLVYPKDTIVTKPMVKLIRMSLENRKSDLN